LGGSAGQPDSGSGGAASSTSAAAANAGHMASGGSGGDAGAGTGAGATNDGGKGGSSAVTPRVTASISTPPITVELSSEGFIDWAHWGMKSAADYSHKSGVISQLLDFKPLGEAAAGRYLDGPTTFSWSDGTPTLVGSTKDGVSWQGIGEGFQLVVPALPELRKLRLYLGVFACAGTLKAALSDARASTPVESRFSSDKQEWLLQVVTLEYGDTDKPDATLNASWRVEAATSSTAAVSLTALSISQ
jgi:hypothetical protein